MFSATVWGSYCLHLLCRISKRYDEETAQYFDILNNEFSKISMNLSM